MVLQEKNESQNQLSGSSTPVDEKQNISKGKLPTGSSIITARLEELEALPHRHAFLHWGAFILSLFSLVILSTWVLSSHGSVLIGWILLDIGLGVLFAVEFFTRSGFRWNRAAYLRTHFFDFVAIIPALVLVNHGIAIELVWVWVIVAARFARVINRLLGDGFVRRNVLALLEGFLEETTDRVLRRIIMSVQSDMDKAGFSHGVAAAFMKNKSAVLQRVRAATPHEGLVPEIAHIVGLDAALERAEERTYDAVVGIIDSEEVDQAVRDVVSSAFARMSNELGKKSWRQHFGIRRRRTNENSPDSQRLN